MGKDRDICGSQKHSSSVCVSELAKCWMHKLWFRCEAPTQNMWGDCSEYTRVLVINVLRTRERNQYALSTFCLFNNGRIGIRSQDHQSSRLRSYLCAMEAAEDLQKLWIFLLHSSNRFFVNDQEDEVRFPPGAPNCGCMGECASSHPKVGFYKPRLALHCIHLISSHLL